MIDILAANPFITINRAAKVLGVAYTTAQRAITKLESLQVVKLAGESKRDRVYCANQILEILEEPARLRPM